MGNIIIYKQIEKMKGEEMRIILAQILRNFLNNLEGKAYLLCKKIGKANITHKYFSLYR